MLDNVKVFRSHLLVSTLSAAERRNRRAIIVVRAPQPRALARDVGRPAPRADVARARVVRVGPAGAPAPAALRAAAVAARGALCSGVRGVGVVVERSWATGAVAVAGMERVVVSWWGGAD